MTHPLLKTVSLALADNDQIRLMLNHKISVLTGNTLNPYETTYGALLRYIELVEKAGNLDEAEYSEIMGS